jgi:hypothetical protein
MGAYVRILYNCLTVFFFKLFFAVSFLGDERLTVIFGDVIDDTTRVGGNEECCRHCTRVQGVE